MIKRKEKICKACGLPKFIWSHGLCQSCDAKQRKPLNKRKKSTGEKMVFLKIWEERPHICTNCKAPLGEIPAASFFSHIKSKGAHPELRLVESNIELLCTECHHAWEFQGLEAFNKRHDK